MTDMQQFDAEALYLELARQCKLALAQHPQGLSNVAIVGIYSGGAWLAQRLARDCGIQHPVGFIDVSLLRKGMNELETVGENYSSLLKLAEDDKIIEVYTQNYTESSQGNNSMGPVYYDSELDSWYSFSDKKF